MPISLAYSSLNWAGLILVAPVTWISFSLNVTWSTARQNATELFYSYTSFTLPGAIYLAAIAEMPNIAFRYLPESNVFFGVLGGTAILIVVGVALDTVKQIESQLQQHNYEGFLR